MDGDGLFCDRPKPASQVQAPFIQGICAYFEFGSFRKLAFSWALFLVQFSVEAAREGKEGNKHAPVVAHRTGHPRNYSFLGPPAVRAGQR